VRISGFTFVRNGVKLDYPFIESIRSLLPLVDELVVNVPKSEDETLARVRAIGDSKLKIFESDWDESMREGGRILSLQTNRALEQCQGELAIYLQADEVLHEADYPAIRAALRLYADRTNNGSIVSEGDACGFRRADGKPMRVKKIKPRVFHYGWARPLEAMQAKNRELERLYHDDGYIEKKYDRDRDLAACLPFRGSHPAVMAERIAGADWQLDLRGRRLPLALQPRAWRLLLKKWGIWK